MIGNHEFQLKSSSVSSENSKQHNISKNSITNTLVGPYSIMMRDKSKKSKSYSLIQLPNASTCNESQVVATSIHVHKHGPKTLYYDRSSLDRDLGSLTEGVAQYLDVTRSNLMSFGGISHNVY